MTVNKIAAAESALLSALNRAPPLVGLFEPVRYFRELRAHMENDGTISMQLDRKFFRRYKSYNRKNRKLSQNPPPIDPEKILSVLNSIIDTRFCITAIDDEKVYIKIFVRERKL